MKQQSGGAFIAGIAVGVLAGVAVGLLLAPRAGEETRETILERGIELKGRFLERDVGQVTAEIATRPANAVGGSVEQFRSYLFGLLDHARRTWQLAIEQGRHEASRTEQMMLRDYERQVNTSHGR